MNSKDHFLLGIFFAFSLYLASPFVNFFGAFLIFFGAFFIDVDGWFCYVLKERKFSICKSYKWALEIRSNFQKLSRKKRNKTFPALRVFHNIETLVLISLLGFFISQYFYFILIGMVFHLILDWVYQREHYHDRFDKLSLINDYLKSKNLKKL